MRNLVTLCFVIEYLLFALPPVLAKSIRTVQKPITEIHVVCEEWSGYTNKDGTGSYWEIVKQVFEPVGIRVETQTMPWKRAKFLVREKHVDALVGDYYDPVAKDFYYPKWHISVEDPVVAFFKKGRFENWDSEGISILADKRVVWIRGYDYHLHFLQGISVQKHEIASLDQGLKLVKIDRDDALLDYEISIRQEAEKLKMNIDDDYVMKVANPGNKLYVVFAKTVRSKRLLRIFDERMEKLAESGEIEAIYMKWGFKPEKFGMTTFTNN